MERAPTARTFDASVRNIVLPAFALTMLRRRRAKSQPHELDAVFGTRNGRWHQVVTTERRCRAIRKDTGVDRVTLPGSARQSRR